MPEICKPKEPSDELFKGQTMIPTIRWSSADKVLSSTWTSPLFLSWAGFYFMDEEFSRCSALKHSCTDLHWSEFVFSRWGLHWSHSLGSHRMYSSHLHCCAAGFQCGRLGVCLQRKLGKMWTVMKWQVWVWENVWVSYFKWRYCFKLF